MDLMKITKASEIGQNPICAIESGNVAIYSISIPLRDLNTVHLKMERTENGWLNVIEWRTTNFSQRDGLNHVGNTQSTK